MSRPLRFVLTIVAALIAFYVVLYVVFLGLHAAHLF